jgi:hypothetical protein
MSLQYRSGEISLDKINQSIRSWIGHAEHADTWHLRKRLFSEAVFQRGDAKSAARGFLEQQQEQRALRKPQQKQPEQQEQQYWFSVLQDM